MQAAPHRIETDARTPWLAAFAAYGAYAMLALVVCYQSFASMAHIWLHSSAYNHGALMGPLAVFLIGSRRGHYAGLAPRLWPGALLAVAGAGALWSAGRMADAQIIEHLAIVLLLVCGVALIFGPALTKAWAFPLAFSFFMVPFGETLITPLQYLTTQAVTLLLNLSAIAATADQFIITINAGRFHIAEGCAGLRFLLAALIVSSLFSYYVFTSWKARTAFLGFSIIIAIMANILRVYAVLLIASLSGGASNVVEDHLTLGWVFYAVALGALVFTGLKIAERKGAA